MNVRPHALMMVALMTAGCQSIISGSGVELVRVAPTNKLNVFSGRPSIGGTAPSNGLGQLNFRLKIKGSAPVAEMTVNPVAGRYGVLDLPVGDGSIAADFTTVGFTQAIVALHSASANGAFDPVRHTRTFVKADFNGTPDVDGYYTTSVNSFGPLRPATNYVSEIYLMNDPDGAGPITAQRLSASARNTNVSVKAGPNNIDFTCTVNTEEANYNFSASNYGNYVGDGGIVRGDTVTFNTGIANNQPGVTKVVVDIVGFTPAYSGSTDIIRNITDPNAFATFSWNTLANGVALNGETYQANNLNQPAPGDINGLSGTIDIIAYNARNEEVGRTAYPITVFGTPTTTIRIK